MQNHSEIHRTFLRPMAPKRAWEERAQKPNKSGATMRRHHQYIAVPKVSSDFIISENLQLHVARILEDISGCISSFHETVMARGLSFFFSSGIYDAWSHDAWSHGGLHTVHHSAIKTACYPAEGQFHSASIISDRFVEKEKIDINT